MRKGYTFTENRIPTYYLSLFLDKLKFWKGVDCLDSLFGRLNQAILSFSEKALLGLENGHFKNVPLRGGAGLQARPHFFKRPPGTRNRGSPSHEGRAGLVVPDG